MGKVYHINTVSALGEFDEKYGQRYWGQAYDEDLPISFNSKRVDILDGKRIYADETQEKVSSKGNKYLQLKKIKFEEEADKSVPFQEKAEPVFKDTAYQRDITPLALDVWRGIKDNWDVRTVHKDASESADLFDAVAFHTNELISMIETVRNGGSVAGTILPVPIKEPDTAATGYDRAKETRAKLDEPPPSDEDYPEEFDA